MCKTSSKTFVVVKQSAKIVKVFHHNNKQYNYGSNFEAYISTIMFSLLSLVISRDEPICSATYFLKV